MEEFALIKSRVNLNHVNLGIALISDLKVSRTMSKKSEGQEKICSLQDLRKYSYEYCCRCLDLVKMYVARIIVTI